MIDLFPRGTTRFVAPDQAATQCSCGGALAPAGPGLSTPFAVVYACTSCGKEVEKSG